MSDAFQIHVSGMQMMEGCGEQFRRRHIEGETIPPSSALAIGSATHKSVAADLDEKMRTGSLLSQEAILDVARDAAVESAEFGLFLEEDETEESAKGQIIDMATKLAVLHHTDVAPDIEPIYLNRKFTLDIKGMSSQVCGEMDIQIADGIRDTKTAAKSPSGPEADDSIQLTTYALAYKAAEGKIPKTVGLDFLVKLKTPKAVSLTSTRTVEHFPHLFARLERAEQVIQTGLFTPAPTNWWGCSKARCGYWSTCKFAARPVTVARGG